MDQKLITLPDREETLRRLISVLNDAHVIQGLYARLLPYAGTEKVPIGVVQMIYVAMFDYAEEHELNEATQRMLEGLVLRFAEALVDDADFLTEVRRSHQLIIATRDSR
jgi:hypothetical protein